MSHIATVEVQIKDLDCLAKAAERCGLEFKRDQKNFRWYGKWMADYDADDAAYKRLGIDPKDYGKCLHALSVKDDTGRRAYEIGVVENPKGGFALLWDFFAGGQGLMKNVSAETDTQQKGIGKLQQMYALEVAKKNAKKRGFAVKEQPGKNGEIKLVCTR